MCHSLSLWWRTSSDPARLSFVAMAQPVPVQSNTSAEGCKTPQYKVIKEHMHKLGLVVKQDLSKVAMLLFQKDCIGVSSLKEAQNANLASDDRSNSLMVCVLEKIELNPATYDVFVSILHEVPGSDETISELEKTLLKFQELEGAIVQLLKLSSHFLPCHSCWFHHFPPHTVRLSLTKMSAIMRWKLIPRMKNWKLSR